MLEQLSEILTFIRENPQIAASYGTLISVLVTLVVAVTALIQTRTSRSALSATRQSLEVSRRQAITAETAFHANFQQSRRDWFDRHSPLVSVVPLSDPEHVLAGRTPMVRRLSDEFDAVRNSFDWSQKLEVDREGARVPKLNSAWLSGRVLLKNEGSFSAMVRPFSWDWVIVDGPQSDDLMENGAFLLEPGVRIVLRWFHSYPIMEWMRDAAAACRDRTEYANNPLYNYKYLGIDGDSRYLSIYSLTIPRLMDTCEARFNFLPLCDEWYADRDRMSNYEVLTDPASVDVVRRVRRYPDDDLDSKE